MELDASMLRPIVRHALDAAVAVPVEWSVVPILAGDGPGLGVFRVSGSARVGGESRAWSVILTVLPRAPGSPTEWNYPAREALAYGRGLLDDLPPDLRRRCASVTPSTAAGMTCGLRTWARMRFAGGSTTTGRRRERLDGSMARISRGVRCRWPGGLAGSGFAPGWPRVPLRCASFLASKGTRSYGAYIRARSSIACFGCGRIVKSSSTRLTDCPKCSATTMHSVGICS
jgi:hypothetical protein